MFTVTLSEQRRAAKTHLLRLSSVSAALRGAFEGQLRHNAAWRLCSPQMLLLFPVFGGCNATIIYGLAYPRILCTPEKEERNRENLDITWRRSSLLQATQSVRQLLCFILVRLNILYWTFSIPQFILHVFFVINLASIFFFFFALLIFVLMSQLWLITQIVI